jgi:hypothetical protein
MTRVEAQRPKKKNRPKAKPLISNHSKNLYSKKGELEGGAEEQRIVLY